MVVDQIGKIAQGVYMLGHRAVPVFLVDGDQPALFDAGLAFLGPLYSRQIRQLLHDRQPAWCFLTHSILTIAGPWPISRTASRR